MLSLSLKGVGVTYGLENAVKCVEPWRLNQLQIVKCRGLLSCDHAFVLSIQFWDRLHRLHRLAPAQAPWLWDVELDCGVTFWDHFCETTHYSIDPSTLLQDQSLGTGCYMENTSCQGDFANRRGRRTRETRA